jgi:hypothetical protein
MIVMTTTTEGIQPRWRCDACGDPLGEGALVFFSEPLGRHHLPQPFICCGGGACRALAETAVRARPLHQMPIIAFKRALGVC